MQREVDRLERDLDKAHKVIKIQGKLWALLDQIATDSVQSSKGETK